MNKKYHMLSNIWMSFSEAEIERRHKALKDVMKKENVPAAIVCSRDGVMRSWLLGELAQGFAGAGDILIADGESYSVHDEFLHFRFLEENEDWTEFVSPANYEAVKCASRFSFVPIREAFERAGVCRLGIYRPDEMNVAMARYLEQHLPEFTYVDLTEEFERVHMVRSEEEQHFSQKSVDILEKTFAAIPAVLSVGKTEYENVNGIRAITNDCVMGDMNVYMRNRVKFISNPDGEPLKSGVMHYPGRYLQKGDRVDVMFHCAAENWVYGMVARSFVLADKISAQTQEKWNVAVAANQLAAKLLKPGASLREIAEEVNRYLVSRGSKRDDSVFLYSMYNGIQECPCLYDPSENFRLQKGMIVCVCPVAAFEGIAPMCCGDMYLVTENGAERLGKLSMDLVAVKGL